MGQEEKERLAVLETEVENMKSTNEKIDKRLGRLEWYVWIGVGVVLAVKFLVGHGG